MSANDLPIKGMILKGTVYISYFDQRETVLKNGLCIIYCKLCVNIYLKK